MSEDFFGPPPEPPPEPPRRPSPPWLGPPSGSLPGIVALELVLARSEHAAVCVSRVAAYATGFEFDLLTLSDGNDADLDPYLFGPHRRRLSAGDADTRLRFGVQFADGSKATNVGAGPGGASPFEEPDGPVLHGHGGGGGGGRWRQSFWVWPLPPPGILAVVCQWPAAAIPLTRREIDAALVLEAASRAQQILPNDPPGGLGGGWRSYAPSRG